jgi:hypothetical protein
VEIRDGSPPVIKLNADQRQGLGDNVLDPAGEFSFFFSSFLLGNSARSQFFPRGKNIDLPSSRRGVASPKSIGN